MNEASKAVIPARGGGGFLSHLWPTVLALACIGLVVSAGIRTDWRMPKFSSLMGKASADKDTWCTAHCVPDAMCIECNKDMMPRMKSEWCHEHGVHECPICHPELAELSNPLTVTAEQRDRIARGLAFSPRIENNSQCKFHERRIQLVNEDILDDLDIRVEQARPGQIAESITAPGEITYDPTRLARLSTRLPGTVFRVNRSIGQHVHRGDVLALIDAADVGKAKAEFQQAIANLELRQQTLASLRGTESSIAVWTRLEAEAALQDAQVRLVTAEQSLANLGMTIRSADVRGLTPSELMRWLQFLGLPESLQRDLDRQTASSNLIPITAPFDGEIVQLNATDGEAANPAKVMFVVADRTQMWLTLRVRTEDADRIKPGMPVRFEHSGHPDGDEGTVAWISPSADEKSRAVPVRVTLPNRKGVHEANTFGTGQVVLRVEPKATVVPSSAVHWEGDCHLVFVRDRNFDKPDGPKVFHTRTVRLGGQDADASGPVTEILGGLLPGEWVATTNSGIFRSELLKNNLGAG